MSQAVKKSIFFSILLAFSLSASFAFAAPLAPQEGPRYFIKTNNSFWHKSFGVRHVFENGFTADLSGIQVALSKLFGLEVVPVELLHILPESVINHPEAGEPLAKSEKPAGKPVEPVRVVPTDQTPWGIETIYNNSLITLTSGGLNVNVAVLDTGILKIHPDLVSRIKQCKDFTAPKVSVKDLVCEDKHGHGTHVAGVILADGGADKLGIYGVAPEANVYAYKVCGNDGSCWADDIAVAIRTAADNGTNVINLSLGSDLESGLIRDAINYAVGKDVLIVAAAGNDGPYPVSIDYPAADPNVIGVGAFDLLTEGPEWSSRGDNPNTAPYTVEKKDMEFGAPGVNIESTWKNGGYVILSGTSMASPHIAGLAAKYWQSEALKGTKAQKTRDLLQAIAKDIWTLGDDEATGFGLPQVK